MFVPKMYTMHSKVFLFGFFVCMSFPSKTFTEQCFPPPINQIFSSSQDDFYCPWYRNLIRHVPVEEGLCPPSTSGSKVNKNCISDKDCTKDSYCCFSICHGITRCYNPYQNEWADKLGDIRPPPCSGGSNSTCMRSVGVITTTTPSSLNVDPFITTTSDTLSLSEPPISTTEPDYDQLDSRVGNGTAKFVAEEDV